MRKFISQILAVLFLFIIFSYFGARDVSAHCDTLDGPVVSAARKSLETENVNYVLIWIKPENEDEIRKALKRAREKRKNAKSQEEKDQADREFFETVVRVHREGEGAPYEGLKPAGQVEPELALADKAVESGKLDDILEKITSEETKDAISLLFHQLREKSNYDVNDLTAGREYIEAYVKFIHSVEKAIKEKLV